MDPASPRNGEDTTDINESLGDIDSSGKRFRRTYVACLNCRVRKVKCDLGPVSSPKDRCVRCARERRDCVFVDSKKRKLGKVRGTEPGNSTSVGSNTNGHTGHNGHNSHNSRHNSFGQNNHDSYSNNGSRHNSLGHSNGPAFGQDTNNSRGGSHGATPSPAPQKSTAEKEDIAPKHFSTNTLEGAMVFLANAAGKIANADERDNIDAREKHHQLEGAFNQSSHQHDHIHISGQENAAGFHSSGRNSPAPANMQYRTNSSTFPKIPSTIQAPILAENAHTVTLSNVPSSGTNTPVSDQPPEYLRSSIPTYMSGSQNGRERLMMPPAEDSFSTRPGGSGALSEIEYIGEHGILNAVEAEYLIEMFFATMHPFFPYIPKFLHSPKALSGYPILLCAILTISSRYHSLENTDHAVVAKNIEIHDRLWLYVQRLISQTVWAEASTRSIGTVFAFLLFTEWNPRAIHWRWSDYANRADDATESKEPEPIVANSEPAGLGAMRRSYRMAWMLIGSAVRLAQDTGFMELSTKTYLATHVAEINSVMNMKRRSMLSHSLAELDMDTEEISEAEMETRENNEMKVLGLSEDMGFLENKLQFTEAQKAQIELLQITSVGHESLYGYKAQLGSLSQRQNLSILNFMNPMMNSWSRKYKKYLMPSKAKLVRKINSDFRSSDPKAAQAIASGIENESFIFEFNYTKLYIYSLALSPSPKSKGDSKGGKKSLKLDEISKSAKYIEQAFNAANEILQVAHRVHKLKMLRFMPVRWVTRIVRAVAFMVKCYLTITAHKSSEANADPSSNIDHFDATVLSLSLISVEEIVQSIQKAAITLRDCSPDELHLCTRYSNVLLYLYSEMKATLKNYSVPDDAEDSAEKDHNNNEAHENEISPQQPPRDNLDEGLKEFPDFGFSGDSEMIDWFANNRNVGLDFVGPWTELIEQQIEGQNLNMDQPLNFG